MLLTSRKSLASKKRALFLEVEGKTMRTSKQRGFFLADEELYSVICSHINKEYSVKVPYQLGAQQKINTGRPDQRGDAGFCGRGHKAGCIRLNAGRPQNAYVFVAGQSCPGQNAHCIRDSLTFNILSLLKFRQCGRQRPRHPGQRQTNS